jgi:hypothetical protein
MSKGRLQSYRDRDKVQRYAVTAVTDKELKMDKELENFAKYDGKAL